MCEEMGYPVINMIEKTEEMHIDRSKDYFDMYHVNIHGSIKTTNYLLKYLVGNYGFLNKKGYSDYADWDDAYIAYSEFVKPYVSVDEWQDFNLY